jgi:hypothetical protein
MNKWPCADFDIVGQAETACKFLKPQHNHHPELLENRHSDERRTSKTASNVIRMSQRRKSQVQRPLRRYRRKLSVRSSIAKAPPVSSHPEIDEEIVDDKAGCGADDVRLKLDSPLPPARPIVSVDGKDVKDARFRNHNAA